MRRVVSIRPKLLSAFAVFVAGLIGVSGSLSVPAVGAAVARHQATGHRHHRPPSVRTYNKCRRSPIDVPSCGVLWGAYRPPVKARPMWTQRFGQFEHKIGRRFDIVKDYQDWAKGDVFPSKREAVLARHGKRILYISWNAQNFSAGHTKVSYASIASGQWDKSVIIPEARRLKAFHQKIFIDFNHEFDTAAQQGSGTPQQYVAAYRHIHDVMQLFGVHNIIWSWVVTGFLGNRSAIAAGYPGAKYVDWVGWDPYNKSVCRGNSEPRTAYQNFSPFYHWAAHRQGMKHKPFLLSEYAAAVSEPHVQRWYASIPNTLRRLPRLKALIQFSGHAASPPNCDVSLADSSAAMAGFAQASMSPRVSGAGR
jgi:hypothetical protein